MSRKKRDEDVAVVVVYGTDKTGTLRAGWITKKKLGAVRRAASKMRMRTFVVRGLIAEYVMDRIAAARFPRPRHSISAKFPRQYSMRSCS